MIAENYLIRQALEIIRGYAFLEPLHHYLKQVFRSNKKMGARDRRNMRDLVYAYYDSYTNDYIVLQSYPDHTAAIYGVYTKVDDEYGFIKVEGRVSTPPDIELGSVVTVMNKLNLCASPSNTIWGNLVDSGETPIHRTDCADWQQIESNRNN